MRPYEGKTVWIIGASSGIGEALAAEMAAQGAMLILTARSVDKLEVLNQRLGSHHRVIAADAGNPESLVAAAQSFERLDSVIFMAALYTPHSNREKDIHFINDMISINLGGAFNTVNAVLPLYRQQAYGQIALCASVAGYRGLPYGQPYCSTKAGMISYAESLKIELEDDNIDVKVINPGFVKTPLTDKNDFAMPMMIPAEAAANIIAREMLSKRFEIHFPKQFTYLMKLIDILPRWIYFPLARLMKKAQ